MVRSGVPRTELFLRKLKKNFEKKSPPSIASKKNKGCS